MAAHNRVACELAGCPSPIASGSAAAGASVEAGARASCGGRLLSAHARPPSLLRAGAPRRGRRAAAGGQADDGDDQRVQRRQHVSREVDGCSAPQPAAMSASCQLVRQARCTGSAMRMACWWCRSLCCPAERHSMSAGFALLTPPAASGCDRCCCLLRCHQHQIAVPSLLLPLACACSLLSCPQQFTVAVSSSPSLPCSAASNIKVTDTAWPADGFVVEGELTAAFDSIPVGTSVQHRCGRVRAGVGCWAVASFGLLPVGSRLLG